VGVPFFEPPSHLGPFCLCLIPFLLVVATQCPPSWSSPPPPPPSQPSLVISSPPHVPFWLPSPGVPFRLVRLAGYDEIRTANVDQRRMSNVVLGRQPRIHSLTKMARALRNPPTGFGRGLGPNTEVRMLPSPPIHMSRPRLLGCFALLEMSDICSQHDCRVTRRTASGALLIALGYAREVEPAFFFVCPTFGFWKTRRIDNDQKRKGRRCYGCSCRRMAGRYFGHWWTCA
jgi:hypothetical protein